VLQQQIEGHPQRRLIEKAIVSLLAITRQEKELPEWQLVSGCLADISEALEVFRPHRSLRKISVFGSARTRPTRAMPWRRRWLAWPWRRGLM